MVVAPRKDLNPNLVEHSIRTLLAAPRERSLHLTLHMSNGKFATSLKAVDEDEIIYEAKNHGLVDLVKRSRDVKKVRDACDVARQYFFEVATLPNGAEKGFDPISRRQERRREEGRKVVVGIEEKVCDPSDCLPNYPHPLPAEFLAGKLARVGLPPDPWRDFKIQSLKLFTEIVSWI